MGMCKREAKQLRASKRKHPDEAHVQDARRAGQHVARNVDIAPRNAERPVAWNSQSIGLLVWVMEM